MGAAPRHGTVCFQTGAALELACAVTTSVDMCACSYDGGASLTYTYRFQLPPICPTGFCATDEPLGDASSAPDGTGTRDQTSPPLPLPPPPTPPIMQRRQPPPPPPMPPGGWCHTECPQSVADTTVLDAHWRSTANIYAYRHSWDYNGVPTVAQYNRFAQYNGGAQPGAGKLVHL
jgi:hypothetical protein